ncbi:MAG: hypothetical protein JRG76_06665 [Deltaproteobacteria bacterium]|nr:hypothetical protein [Deltaproteobacteria bacterium]MBW2414176.1 hypothetical protein [Deltaproteobacteria bacterium]
MSLAATRAALERAGFNLTAPLSAREYDAIVAPEWRSGDLRRDCRSVLIVANGGGALWDCFQRAPEWKERRDPLDRYTSRVLRECGATHFASYRDRRRGRMLPLVALAECAGLGSPGRLGLLLHPVYGPWMSLRAVVYSSEEVVLDPAPVFNPCTGCAAPCVSACRGGALDGDGFDGSRCFRTKLLDAGCRTACDARAACVLAPEHAFPADQVAHHSRIGWTPGLALHALRVMARRS